MECKTVSGTPEGTYMGCKTVSAIPEGTYMRCKTVSATPEGTYMRCKTFSASPETPRDARGSPRQAPKPRTTLAEAFGKPRNPARHSRRRVKASITPYQTLSCLPSFLFLLSSFLPP